MNLRNWREVSVASVIENKVFAYLIPTLLTFTLHYAETGSRTIKYIWSVTKEGSVGFFS